MALTNCPECSNKCSSSATSCPKCGHPFQNTLFSNVSGNQTNTSQTWKILTLVIGVLALGLVTFAIYQVYFSNSKNSDATKVEAITNSNNNNLEKDVASKMSKENPVNKEIVEQVQKPTPIPTGKLDLEAGIIYKMGGSQPVGREKFYLLNQDLESVLRESGIKPKDDVGYIATFGFSINYPDQYKGVSGRALSQIKRHVKYTVITDFDGKATFEDVKVGEYYIFGITQTRGAFAIWNLKIKIKSGENSIVLDQGNAEVAL